MPHGIGTHGPAAVARTDGASEDSISPNQEAAVSAPTEIAPPSPRRPTVRRWTAAALCAAAALAVVGAAVGAQPDYARGFAPPATGLFGAVLGLLALPGRAGLRQRALGWGAVALLLWSGAGLLFDVLRAAAVLGVPGLPPEVDLLGLVRRAVSMLAAVLLAFHLLSRRSSAPLSPLWGIAGALATVPYPALKLYWWAGGEGASEFSSGAGSSVAAAFPVMELFTFGLAALWSLALVTVRGPAMARRVLVLGGWTAAIMLLNMGALAGFGTLADVTGVVDGPFESSPQGLMVALVYGSWFALGLCLGRAALGPGPSRPALAIL